MQVVPSGALEKWPVLMRMATKWPPISGMTDEFIRVLCLLGLGLGSQALVFESPGEEDREPYCQHLVNRGSIEYLIDMKMAESHARGSLELLGDLAAQQEGYFSASQAAASGIERHRLQRLARQGVIERDERGVYRFVVYPHGDRAELWRAVLWPSLQRSNFTGVLSYATALGLHEVSTINPAKIDLSIPCSMRLRRSVPSAYRIHLQNFEPSEVTHLYGLPVTTIFRTLFDLIVLGEDRQFAAEALEEAPRRGLLTDEEVQRLRALSAVDLRLLRKVARA